MIWYAHLLKADMDKGYLPKGTYVSTCMDAVVENACYRLDNAVLNGVVQSFVLGIDALSEERIYHVQQMREAVTSRDIAL